MVFERIGRRGFLGSVAVAVTSLAGCGEETGSPEADSSSVTEPDAPQQQGTVSGGRIPAHDHSSEAMGGRLLKPSEIRATARDFPYGYVIYHRDGEVRAFDCAAETERFSGEDATAVIQSAVDELDAGTIFVRSGTYEIGPAEDSWLGGILLHSDIRIVGEGPGATIFKLKDDINGRRGEIRASPFAISEYTSRVAIENLEIDGNESNNRDIPPYPLAPHHHGIVITGESEQVPEDRKPSDILLRNLYIHDTVRSNIVVAGRNCELENLWLANSATDHWLYLGGATNCNIRNVHMSGFARAEGIVFGVGRRRCYGNTLSDVTFSNFVETPYQNDAPEGIGGRYPLLAISLRHSSGFAHHNTVRDVRIRLDDAPHSSAIPNYQPNTRLQNIDYVGPVDRGPLIWNNPPAQQTSIEHLSVEITDVLDDGAGSIVLNEAPDFSITDSTLVTPGNDDIEGVRLSEGARPVARNVMRQCRIATGGPVLRVNRGQHGVPDLLVDGLFDVNDRGTAGLDRIEPVELGVY